MDAMIWKPHVTVAAVVQREGRFLLVEEQIDGARVINQPAGHLDEGESLLDAVVREAREETAWRFVPEAVVGVYRWRVPESGTTYLRITFCGGCEDHRPEQPLDAGIMRTLWLDRAQIQARTEHLRSPLVLRSIDDYLAGRRYPLALLVDMVPDV